MKFNKILDSLNNSKCFLGFLMAFNIIGSKYIFQDISNTFEHILKKPITRIIFFFSALFIVVRDVKISLLLTIAAIVLYNSVVLEHFQDTEDTGVV